ncbi:hypothetical protein ACFXTO_011318 [Malus domestica]
MSQSVDYNLSYTDLGLNGVAYNSKGYLLVVQSNTDKMFKVDADDGTANLGNGDFYDKIALDPEGSPTLVAVYGEDKVYVLRWAPDGRFKMRHLVGYLNRKTN